MLDCYAILNEAYDNIKTIKKIDNGPCTNCKKKMRPIKNDWNKRQFCKKCYFELEEERKFKEFIKN